MLKNIWITWRKGEQGATAIEYALIATAVSIGIGVTVFAMGDHLYDFMAGLSAFFSR